MKCYNHIKSLLFDFFCRHVNFFRIGDIGIFYESAKFNTDNWYATPNIYLDAVNLTETADYLMKEIHISSYGNRRQQHILR